jgi:hypothetical protein
MDGAGHRALHGGSLVVVRVKEHSRRSCERVPQSADVPAQPTMDQIAELVERWHYRQSFEEIATALEVDRLTISRWTPTNAVKLAALGLKCSVGECEERVARARKWGRSWTAPWTPPHRRASAGSGSM